MALVTVIATLAPWVVGTAVLYSLLRPQTASPAQHCLIVGAGAYVGYVLLAAAMAAVLAAGLNPFSSIALGGWAAVSVGSVGVIIYRVRACQRLPAAHTNTPVGHALTGLGGLWLLALVAWLTVEVWHSPIMAWDVVWVWGLEASEQLSSALGPEPRITAGGTHPATMVMVLAWSAFWANIGSTHVLGAGPWLVAYAGIVLMTLGLVQHVARHWTVAVWLTAAVVSAPLIEAHTAQGGYADLWVLAGVVAGLCLGLGVTRDHPQRAPTLAAMLAGALVLISVAWIKNNGVAYTVIGLAGLGLGALLTGRRAAVGYLAVGGVGLVVGVVLVWGVAVDIGPFEAGYSPDRGEIRLGNRAGGLADVALSTVMFHLWHAWVMASSFGVMFAASLVGLPVATVYALLKKDRVGTTLALSAWGLISFLIVAQFSEYFLPVATPANDTGLSRASHAVYWVTALAAITTALNAARWMTRRDQNTDGAQAADSEGRETPATRATRHGA
ncbi:MAG: hypothetical protein RI542_08370 [Wenzhouxiangella sp.]|jgi:hypothetical protein|nr:hypothetical protein [Wenzhouxiangella sp.]